MADTTHAPARLWGGETQKAVENFPVSGEPIPAAVIHWLGRIKAAAARVNADLGLLDADLAGRIAAAADEVAAGSHDDQFPIDVFQTGTGLNTHPEFAARVRELLVADTRLTISPPADPFESQAARDGLVETSGALKTVAVSLTKIANDLRWMGSGPRTGLAEIVIPELQKGSSIMPGKVNPVIPEVVCQVAAQVIGNDAAVTVGGLQGNFELNVQIPLMARNLLQSIELLAAAGRLFAERCVEGIDANRERNEHYAEVSLTVATALNPYIGYDAATAIVKDAAASGRSLRDVAREHGVDEATLDKALDLRGMARGGN